MAKSTKDKVEGTKRKTTAASSSKSESPKPEKFPHAVRLVKKGRVLSIELYFDKRQALEAGVDRRIADAVFADVKVAYCYPDPLPPNLIGCKSRTAPDNCNAKCVLYGNGKEIGTGYHLFKKGVTYSCKCE